MTKLQQHDAMKRRVAEMMSIHGDLTEEFLTGCAFGMAGVFCDFVSADANSAFHAVHGMVEEMARMRDTILAERNGS